MSIVVMILTPTTRLYVIVIRYW